MYDALHGHVLPLPVFVFGSAYAIPGPSVSAAAGHGHEEPRIEGYCGRNNGVGGWGGEGGEYFVNTRPASYPSSPGLLSATSQAAGWDFEQASPSSNQHSEISWPQSTPASLPTEIPSPTEPLFDLTPTGDNTWLQYVCAECGNDCKTRAKFRSVARCPQSATLMLTTQGQVSPSVSHQALPMHHLWVRRKIQHTAGPRTTRQ